MTTTALQKIKSLKLYSVLKSRVYETLLKGQQRIEREKVLIYWNTGKLINEHVRLNGGPAEYAQKVMLKLEKDLGVDETILRRTAQFQAAFPIRAGWRELAWSHYRALIPVKDESERNRLADLAASKHWKSEDLELEIKRLRYEQGRLPAGISEPLVEPKAGIPGLYRVIESGGGLSIDLGFASYVDLSKTEARGIQAGEIVAWDGTGKPVLRKDAGAGDLYTYPAELVRVVDGDTVWMKVILAGPHWVKEKLRFRGIDTPELGTSEGEAAKRFTASAFSQAKSVTITTTKPDKWDRYLSDVFLEMEDGEIIYLNNQLLETGHAIRYDRVRPEDWD